MPNHLMSIIRKVFESDRSIEIASPTNLRIIGERGGGVGGRGNVTTGDVIQTRDKRSRRKRETRDSDSGPTDRRHSSPLLFTVRGTCIPVYPIQTAIFSFFRRREALHRSPAKTRVLFPPSSIIYLTRPTSSFSSPRLSNKRH